MKVYDNVPFLFYCAAIGAAVFACSRERHAAVSAISVKPPFEKVQVQTRTYEVDAVKGGEVNMPNGTYITVPANAFVDEKGNPVKDKVSIEYQEFHNAAEIMASGIPMNYDSAGEHLNFQSAGMFQINGQSNGQPVSVAQGKSLTVSMASTEAGSQYNFFRYDPEKHNWDLKGTATAEPNRQKQQELASLGDLPKKPIMPAEIDHNATVLDLDVNYALYPELKSFDDVLWQYAGTDPAQDPKNFTNALGQTNWSNVKLSAVDIDHEIYRLDLDCNGKHFITNVKPVLQGKDLKKARERFGKYMADYKQQVKAHEDEQARLTNEADLLRTFAVSNFGIYNWDCAMHDPAVVQAPATFHFDQRVSNNVTVYLISGDDRKIVTYYPGTWNEFAFNPNTRNCLVAVMPGDRLAVFGSDDFAKIDDLEEGKHIDFNLKTIDRGVKNVEDLYTLLRQI